MAKQVIEVWGLNEIDKALKLLPQSLQYKFVQDTYANVLTTTVVKIAKQLVRVGKRDMVSKKVPSRSHTKGNLKRSIGVVRGNNKKFPIVFGGVRSKRNFKKGGQDDGWYAHMVEFGHKDPKGGDVQPRPFMRPAWDQAKGRVEGMIGVAFGKQVTRFLKRMTAKQTKSL